MTKDIVEFPGRGRSSRGQTDLCYRKRYIIWDKREDTTSRFGTLGVLFYKDRLDSDFGITDIKIIDNVYPDGNQIESPWKYECHDSDGIKFIFERNMDYQTIDVNLNQNQIDLLEDRYNEITVHESPSE